MLVLGRKVGEEVVIKMPDGKLAIVTVVAIGRGGVRLGFEAADGIKIIRGELEDRTNDRFDGRSP